MNTDTMTRDEKTLLLYLETCAVDKSGRIDSRHINSEDQINMIRWADNGFIETGRICFDDVSDNESIWVHLTPQAYDLAHQLRRERAERSWTIRKYRTTEEARA